MLVLWIGLGGGLGAIFRYALSVLINTKSEHTFPWSTLTVNLLGCFLIGLLWQYLSKSTNLNAFWLIGFLGGFTTFSAYSLDIANLWERGAAGLALIYALGTVVACIVAIFAGLYLARAVNL